jgi:protein-S-isoprenylcysteine O-methyltransferase Ste14
MSTLPMRLLLVVVFAGLFLALAVAARGGIGAFFSQPALIGLTVVLIALRAAALVAGGNLSPGVREDTSNRWVIAVFGVITLLLVFLPPWSDRKGIWIIDGDAIRWLGVALFAAGGALRLWPVFVLGDRFSGLVAIQPGHRLVTSGVYGVIRQPSYLGLLISSLGWGLAFRSGIGVLLAALLVPPLLARIAALAIRCRVRRLSRADVTVGTGAILGSSPIKKGSEQDIYSDADIYCTVNNRISANIENSKHGGRPCRGR